MSGSWEIRQANQVLVAILHTEFTSMAWAFGLKNLQIPGRIMGPCGMPFDHARNAACEAALQGGFDYLFFLDSDVIPPNDAILRLMTHNLPLVSGVYHRRSYPHGIPVMQRGGGWITQYPANSLIEVDYVGAGCMLMRRDLLEAMVSKPIAPERGKIWFDWRVDNAVNLPPGEGLSEDFAMNLHVRRHLGVKVMVDTGVQCRHIGLAEATYNNFQPCQAVA